MEKKVYIQPRYVCPLCTDGFARTSMDFRPHVRKHHPEIADLVMERWIIDQRYGAETVDRLVQRYIDRLETVMSLNKKGYSFDHYLQKIGVKRSYSADCNLMGLHRRNPGLQTAEDVRAAYERGLVGRFRKASPEKRFQAYLNRDNVILEKKGQADLIEPITALKTIKFVRQQLQEALDPSEKSDEEETETV